MCLGWSLISACPIQGSLLIQRPLHCAYIGLTFLLSFEIEFESDSEDASNNFVGAFVNLYIATKENSIVFQPLQALVPSEPNSVQMEINILKVLFVAFRKCR